MTIHQPIVPPAGIDEFQVLMGDLSPEEYAKRAELKKHRNLATAMIADTHSDRARQLCWILVEDVTPNLYAPAPLDWLDELILFTRRLLIAANQAHTKLDGGYYD